MPIGPDGVMRQIDAARESARPQFDNSRPTANLIAIVCTIPGTKFTTEPLVFQRLALTNPARNIKEPTLVRQRDGRIELSKSATEVASVHLEAHSHLDTGKGAGFR